MVIFYSSDISGSLVRLDREESEHCVRVLRHRAGDEICVIDGRGSLLKCRLIDDNPKCAVAGIQEKVPGFGSHPYHLTMAVCPTKNIDRYEWFAEKATEIGVDVIAPVIGDRSERKVLKTERLSRLVLSASKQSLKGSVPVVAEPVSVRDFILDPFGGDGSAGFGADVDGGGACCHGNDAADCRSCADCGTVGCRSDAGGDGCLKLICYCLDDEQKRVSINDALKDYRREAAEGVAADIAQSAPQGDVPRAAMEAAESDTAYCRPRIAVLIGPEGDFSPEEIALAFGNGWQPVHLGASRLRTETAALVAVTAVYLEAGEGR